MAYKISIESCFYHLFEVRGGKLWGVWTSERDELLGCHQRYGQAGRTAGELGSLRAGPHPDMMVHHGFRAVETPAKTMRASCGIGV